MWLWLGRRLSWALLLPNEGKSSTRSTTLQAETHFILQVINNPPFSPYITRTQCNLIFYLTKYAFFFFFSFNVICLKILPSIISMTLNFFHSPFFSELLQTLLLQSCVTRRIFHYSIQKCFQVFYKIFFFHFSVN